MNNRRRTKDPRFASKDPATQRRRALCLWYRNAAPPEIARLDWRQRRACALRVAGLTFREIAMALGYRAHGFLHTLIRRRFEEERTLIDADAWFLRWGGLITAGEMDAITADEPDEPDRGARSLPCFPRGEVGWWSVHCPSLLQDAAARAGPLAGAVT